MIMVICLRNVTDNLYYFECSLTCYFKHANHAPFVFSLLQIFNLSECQCVFDEPLLVCFT